MDTAGRCPGLGELRGPSHPLAEMLAMVFNTRVPSLPGVFDKPSLSAQPSPVVSTGGVVTLQCRSKYGFDHFALYKKGDAGLYKGSERWYQANFPITTAMPTHSGTYQCYSFSSISPYLWSAPSDPLELVVTGKGVQTKAFVLDMWHLLSYIYTHVRIICTYSI